MTTLDAARLAQLDRSFARLAPSLAREHEARADGLASAQLRRTFLAQPGLPQATLPGSTLQRVRVIEALSPARVWLADDVDGMSLVLAPAVAVEVSAKAGSPDVQSWLTGEALALGADSQLTFGDRSLADVGVCTALGPGHAEASLSEAVARTRVGGHILVRVRAPWDVELYPLLERAKLPVRRYLRDVDHVLLASGHVLDGGGDLVLVERSAEASVPSRAISLEESARAHPYFWLDVDGLSEAQLASFDLAGLARRVELLAERSAPLCSHERLEHREVLVWYDEAGLGFTAELNRKERHLLVSFVPYDVVLERAVTTAAFELFADRFTRARPQRTTRTHQKTLFA